MQQQNSVEIAAKILAGEHMQDDAGIVRVYWAPAQREVRLIEVSKTVDDERGVYPFRFTPDLPDIPYPSVIIQVSPQDYERFRRGELDVPEGFESLELIADRDRNDDG